MTPRRGKSNQIKNLVNSLFTRGAARGGSGAHEGRGDLKIVELIARSFAKGVEARFLSLRLSLSNEVIKGGRLSTSVSTHVCLSV